MRQGMRDFEADLDFDIIDFAVYGLFSKWLADLRARAKMRECADV